MFFINMIGYIADLIGCSSHATTYKILAFTNSEGIIEVVENSKDIDQIDGGFRENCILNHLKSLEGDFGLKKQNFIKSLAFYSVLTFVFAIGDWHLGNLMLNNDGHMFHIDFGFLFGKEPNIK